MPIRRLKGESNSAVDICIEKGDGLFLVTTNENKRECLYLSQILGSEDYFANHQSIKSYKYIGSAGLMEKVFSFFPVLKGKQERFIEIHEKTNVIYLRDEGRVRIPKKEPQQTLSEKKKVLVVDDSTTIQKLLRKILSKSSKLEVVDAVGSAEEAKSFIEREKPDLITLDIHMPGQNGVEFLKEYLKYQNIPVVMISAVSMNEGPLVMEALSHGAVTYIEKPSIDNLDEASEDMLAKLEAVSRKSTERSEKKSRLEKLEFSDLSGLITIGSSTGGTQALDVLLHDLPEQIPPILIAQHIPSVFSKALADRLNDLLPFEVKEAVDGEDLVCNKVYIAPGGHHMALVVEDRRLKVVVTDDPPVNRFRPSVDYLFDSISKIPWNNLVALILTGMGADGAKGLLKLKGQGARTIAQDEASSVVFGMPRKAIELGAAEEVCPLDQMGEKLVHLYNQNIEEIQRRKK